MESVLESAVANGADSLMRAVRAVMPPDAMMLTGAPSVRGFRLEGYGLFFDVEVPAFQPNDGVDAQADGGSTTDLGAAAAVNQLKAYVRRCRIRVSARSSIACLRRLELQVTRRPVPADAGRETAGARVARRGRRCGCHAADVTRRSSTIRPRRTRVR